MVTVKAPTLEQVMIVLIKYCTFFQNLQYVYRVTLKETLELKERKESQPRDITTLAMEQVV